MTKKSKKIMSLLLCFIISVTLAGCNGNLNLPFSGKKAHTLMVYMIGSDLEANGGAGTQDINEIAGSGTDINSANIIVYSGGSAKWHNDNSSADSHTLLELTKDGFVNAGTFSSVSMGESSCLSDFLSYAYENYPAEAYSLIMWNHGNGPLIGYGKDILFDDDSLTLSEMKAALETSPFGNENKLSWVGFDACLMASAELLAVWKDYADYLVASQEVEPAFGWNYSFLKNLTTASSVELTTDITENYLSSCEKYYEERGFDNRDTTLSCIDLRYTGKLEEAINALFRKAKSNLSEDYKILAASRVNSRSLGRASTGSEYDLVDLMDMTKHMHGHYPDECRQIQDIISEATVSNHTNADNLCGISIYYPFYNKDFYKNSWREEYKNIGVLKDYAEYISEYGKFWLGNDSFLSYESPVPEKEDDDTYTLTLSSEQSADFASANYYILQKEGEGIFTKVYSSSQTDKKGNKLSADFDGNILYANTDLYEYGIPQMMQYDTIDNITRYSVFVRLNNSLPIAQSDYPEGYEHKAENYLFQLTVNNKTKEIFQSALIPDESDNDKNALFGGKLEDAELSQWSTLGFLNDRHRFITRYENGLLKPVDEWECTDDHSGSFIPIENFTGFSFMPLDIGEYCFLFEIEDVYGNKYCSEMYPFSISEELEGKEEMPKKELTWDKNEDKVQIIDEQGVSVYLTTTTADDKAVRYTIEAENKNDFSVYIKTDNTVINDSIFLEDIFSRFFLLLDPNEKATAEIPLKFGVLEEYQKLDQIGILKSLGFTATVQTYDGKRIMLENDIRINIPPEKSFIPDNYDELTGWYKIIQYPSHGLFADEQILFEQNGLRAALLTLGGEYENVESQAIKGIIKYENLSDKPKYVCFGGAIFDDISYADEFPEPVLINGGMTIYQELYFQDLYLELNDEFGSPSEMSVCTYYSDCYWFPLVASGGAGFMQKIISPVSLSQHGDGAHLSEEGELIYDNHSVKIYLTDIIPADKNGDDHEYYFTVVNNSDLDIKVTAEHIKTGGIEDSACYSYRGNCIKNTKTRLVVTIREDYVHGDDVTADLYIYDFFEENLLYTEKDVFNLTIPETTLNE